MSAYNLRSVGGMQRWHGFIADVPDALMSREGEMGGANNTGEWGEMRWSCDCPSLFEVRRTHDQKMTETISPAHWDKSWQLSAWLMECYTSPFLSSRHHVATVIHDYRAHVQRSTPISRSLFLLPPSFSVAPPCISWPEWQTKCNHWPAPKLKLLPTTLRRTHEWPGWPSALQTWRTTTRVPTASTRKQTHRRIAAGTR